MKFNQLIHKVRTPINIVNLANGGGMSFSSLVEVYGDSRSGKSTFIYQSLQYFLEDYQEDALVLLLDAEGAINELRLKKAFNIDVSGKDPRIHVEPAFTIEMANSAILKYSQQAKQDGKFLFVVWDSITASGFDRAKDVIDQSIKDGKSDEFERGMTEPMARAQVLKWCLNNSLHAIYRAPVIIFLINQITTKVNRFQTSVDSAGGFALRHNVNERIEFKYGKAIGDHELFKSGTMSTVNIHKSRNFPGFHSIPITIDDTTGGRIVPDNEIPLVAAKLGCLISKSGVWHDVNPEYLPAGVEPWKKSKQLKDIFTNPEDLQFIREAIKTVLRKEFILINELYLMMDEYAAEVALLKTTAPIKGKK